MNRVLVVDDAPNSLSAMCGLLEMDGFDAVGAPGGQAALDALRAGRFDAVVTDLEMPGVHGLEVVRAAAAATVPVFVVSAYASSAVAARALELGAGAVLSKPLAYERLLDVLAAAMHPGRAK
ncbi:MAG TPA: response regulator [Myxococcaceae bacterium]|nr:response regulator [Myxococcaceae bacterium]